MPAFRSSNFQDRCRQVKHTRLENEAELEKEYNFGEQLGKGSFGTVLSTIKTADSTKWAVKIINKEKAGSAAVKLLEREVSIMKKVDHPHIIFLEEVFETSNKMFLIMEICNRGGLEELLMKKGHFNEKEGLCIFKQLADAIAYIHENDIIHRDLKLDNILLAEPDDEYLYNIKLTDFGLSYTRGGSGSDYMMNQVVGTPIYMAPEVITNYGYSQQCDIWSLGVIIYKIISGDAPFMANTEDELFELIKKGNVKFPPEKWRDISQSAKQIIECMMKVDPAHRITSKEVLQHPWIRGEVNGSTTTNVLEMMKQYNMEQKQLAEKRKSENSSFHLQLASSQSDSSILNESRDDSATSVYQGLGRPKSSAATPSSSSVHRVKSNENNNHFEGAKLTKKPGNSKVVPSYMLPTKSSSQSKTTNLKSKKKMSTSSYSS